VSLHVDTGDITAIDTSAGNTDASLVQELLTECLKEETLLSIIQRRWRWTKNIDQDRWKRLDWSWWQPGDLVAWSDVFPDDPQIVIFDTKKKYLVEDMYCINPDCSCNRIVLAFFELNLSDCKTIGAIDLDSSNMRIQETNPREVSERGLLNLWKTLRNDDPSIKQTLRERREQIQEIGPRIVQTSGNWEHVSQKNRSKPVRKVRRNEPCPCGSNKKYKKCCGR